ncbi:hypothetical protein PR048_005121 [Dryococelus australis]|uniref:Uncharacterized protein n=1 Tax=Dryococelus australis TaxID=614101 RepID=A0ABQ9I8G6_9NEOP|nr:hypothetical protein PR048_005121 [Dryococelus australis]
MAASWTAATENAERRRSGYSTGRHVGTISRPAHPILTWRGLGCRIQHGYFPRPQPAKLLRSNVLSADLSNFKTGNSSTILLVRVRPCAETLTIVELGVGKVDPNPGVRTWRMSPVWLMAYLACSYFSHKCSWSLQRPNIQAVHVIRLLASHQEANRVRFPTGLPPPPPPRFLQVGIMPDDAASWWVFSLISHFSRLCITALHHTHLASPSSTLKTSMFRAARFTLIGSQDLDVKSQPNIFIHYLQKRIYTVCIKRQYVAYDIVACGFVLRVAVFLLRMRHKYIVALRCLFPRRQRETDCAARGATDSPELSTQRTISKLGIHHDDPAWPQWIQFRILQVGNVAHIVQWPALGRVLGPNWLLLLRNTPLLARLIADCSLSIPTLCWPVSPSWRWNCVAAFLKHTFFSETVKLVSKVLIYEKNAHFRRSFLSAFKTPRTLETPFQSTPKRLKTAFSKCCMSEYARRDNTQNYSRALHSIFCRFSTNKIIGTPLKVPYVHVMRRYYGVPIESLALRGNGAFDVCGSLVLIASALLGLARKKKKRYVCGSFNDWNIVNCELQPHTIAKWHHWPAKYSNAFVDQRPVTVLTSRQPSQHANFRSTQWQRPVRRQALSQSLAQTGAPTSKTTVAERLGCSPPTNANRVQSQAVGIVPDDAAGRRVFSVISRFPPPFRSSVAPYSPHFTLNGSEDLDVKSRPILFTLHTLCILKYSMCHSSLERGRLSSRRGRSGIVVRLLSSCLGEPGLIPGVPEDATGGRVFSRCSCLSITALRQFHFASPSSVRKTSMSRVFTPLAVDTRHTIMCRIVNIARFSVSDGRLHEDASQLTVPRSTDPFVSTRKRWLCSTFN